MNSTITLAQQHHDFARAFDQAGDAGQKARIAVGAKEHFKRQADGRNWHSEAAVLFQFWSTVARRATYAAK